jgi:folate-binding protein YgfZ
MSSKQNETENAMPEAPTRGFLQRVGALCVEGRDALAFLQRQCMSDLRELEVDGAMQWSGLLSAKGRVLFLFRLIREGAERFLLVAPGSDAEQFAAELGRFVLRSKLTLRPIEGGFAVAIGPAAPHSEGWRAWDKGRWWRLDAPAESDPASLDAAWQHLDTERLIPQIDQRLRDRFTPQMLSLQGLQAFSLTKGCYPGQEIVARTHYLGQQKRELRLLSANRPLQAGEALQDATGSVGEVTQVSALQPQLGLAVLTREAADKPLQLADGSGLRVASG